MRVCVVGQSVKDIYLQIDGEFLRDENGLPHLDLAFDGAERPVLRRTAIKAGSAVAAEVFFKLGHQVDYLDDSFLAHRYIINNGENSVALAEADNQVFWQEPHETPEAVFVDSATMLSRDDRKRIEKYVAAHELILCGYGGPRMANAALWGGENDELKLTLNRLEFSQSGVTYAADLDLAKEHILPDAALRSLAFAALVGAWLRGANARDAVALAKGLVEQATLAQVPRLNSLAEELERLRPQVSVTGSELARCAAKMLERSILAADESTGSIGKKFAALELPNDETTRHNYRKLLFETPDLARYISAVIMAEETTTQLAEDGQPFTDFLARRGIMPGVKVDQGLVALAKSDEQTTEGLDGLPTRLKAFAERGLRFTKWRAVFTQGDHTPSDKLIEANCKALAQYSLDCQQAGLVPIPETELIYDGDYSIETAAATTERILQRLFAYLAEYKVDLQGLVLKMNMILAGQRYKKASTPEEVGAATARVLRRVIPREIGGVVFLSGGQSPEQATANLQAIWRNAPFLFPVTSSFQRATEQPALEAWRGEAKHLEKARKAFIKRLAANQKP